MLIDSLLWHKHFCKCLREPIKLAYVSISYFQLISINLLGKLKKNKIAHRLYEKKLTLYPLQLLKEKTLYNSAYPIHPIHHPKRKRERA